MIFVIATAITNLFGIDFAAAQKWARRVVVFVVILVVIIAGLWLRACNKPPKLDEKAIAAAQQAIAEQDRKVMVEILAESDTKEAEIDSNIKQIEADREAAKKSYEGLSNEELAAELERRK